MQTKTYKIVYVINGDEPGFGISSGVTFIEAETQSDASTAFQMQDGHKHCIEKIVEI